MNSLPFSAIMPQANLEAAAIATVSFTGDIIEEAFARVEGADSAPSVGEAEASEAAPIGDLVQQNAETAVAYEAEAAQEAEEDGLAEEAAEADAAKKAEEECVAREAAELACKTEKERQARNAAAEQPGRPKNSVLPLKLRRKLKRNA